VALDNLQNIIHDSASIPINFEYELRPIRVAVETLAEWVHEHASILTKLGILKDKFQRAAVEASTVNEESHGDRPALTDLQLLAHSSSSFHVNCKTLRLVSSFDSITTLTLSTFSLHLVL
jgi:hypothetical protein